MTPPAEQSNAELATQVGDIALFFEASIRAVATTPEFDEAARVMDQLILHIYQQKAAALREVQRRLLARGGIMTLDHLSTDENPLPRETEIAERETDRFLDRLDRLLADDHAGFAADTLAGIRITVAQTRRVTDPQRTAVDNIEDATVRHREEREDRTPAGWGRRYEGHDRSRYAAAPDSSRRGTLLEEGRQGQ